MRGKRHKRAKNFWMKRLSPKGMSSMSTAGDRWLEFARQDLQMAKLAFHEGIYHHGQKE
jgi:hypothetical protein